MPSTRPLRPLAAASRPALHAAPPTAVRSSAIRRAPPGIAARGTRIEVGVAGSMEQILNGPSRVTDGSENLVGAVRQSAAALGVQTLAAFRDVEVIYAPAAATEGKSWQRGR